MEQAISSETPIEQGEKTVSVKDLEVIIARWRRQAGLYFQKSDKEENPLGKKFYESSAIATANCYGEIRKLIDRLETYAVLEQQDEQRL